MDEVRQILLKIVEKNPVKLIISNPKSKSQDYRKIEIIQKKDYLQIAKYTQKQVFHENIEKVELLEFLSEQMLTFSQLNAWREGEEMEMKRSKKGKVFFKGRKSEQNINVPTEHNRKKNYILSEGQVIPPLVDMGIFTAEGKIVRSMYDKYRQINRFVEMIDDCLKEKERKELRVIDFGCGKSYLTFILYYYLTEIKGINVKMTGLDLKEEVIKNCNQAAKRYGYDGLSFELGDINGYQQDSAIDMVITLHACDTATDYALFNGIQWEAEMIFSVPCCQHEVNQQVKSEEFSLFTKYGIIKDRFSALATDGIRGSLLECCGYSTQLLEFIDISHTPKNILIRAVKQNRKSLKKRQESLREVEQVMQEFHFNQTLYKLLKEAGRLDIS